MSGKIETKIRNEIKRHNSYMKVHEVIELCNKYGKNITLQDLLRIIQGNKIHKCPKCNGSGLLSERYIIGRYLSKLPKKGWVEEWGTKHSECDLCNGEGYTEHKYKPKMVQDGWE